MDLSCKKITIGTLTFDPQEPVKLSHQKIVINVHDPENIITFQLTLEFKEISKIKELYSINNNLIQFMLCPSKVSYIRAKLRPNYKFSVTNKTNKSETFFIVHLADDLEKKTEIALQNFFSPLFHEEIKEENVVTFATDVPLRRNSDIYTEENKQIQYAINESLKAVKPEILEIDVSPQKKRKTSPGEDVDDSSDSNSYVNDALEQDNRVFLIKNTSDTEQEMDTDDGYVNDSLEQMTTNCTNVACNMKINNVSSIAIDDNHNNNHSTFVSDEDLTKTVLVYPDCDDGIRIEVEDYLCLQRKELIVDVIIDFYLKYLYNEVFTDQQRNRTHIFSTHFFSLYSTPSNFNGWKENDNENLNASQKRYLRVENISRNVNLFDKDYIVIPIHYHDHWLLAIVCFPYLKDPLVEDGDNIIVPVANGSRRKRIETVPILRRPCVLVFDSIRGNGPRKTRVIRYVKDYLEHEFNAKREIHKLGDLDFLKASVIGHSVICPEQKNVYDCGLFVCEFVERFFTQPITNYRFPLPDMSEWFDEKTILRKREIIAKTIHNLIDNSNGKYESSLTLPQIQFTKQSKTKSDIQNKIS